MSPQFPIQRLLCCELLPSSPLSEYPRTFIPSLSSHHPTECVLQMSYQLSTRAVLTFISSCFFTLLRKHGHVSSFFTVESRQRREQDCAREFNSVVHLAREYVVGSSLPYSKIRAVFHAVYCLVFRVIGFPPFRCLVQCVVVFLLVGREVNGRFRNRDGNVFLCVCACLPWIVRAVWMILCVRCGC